MNHLFKFFCYIFISLKGLTQFNGNSTPTYPKLVHYFDSLAKKKQVGLYNMGFSDYGLPIYLCVLNGEKDSTKTFKKFKTSTNIFINNGIHPGEPDGINACGLLTQDYVSGKLKIDKNVTFSFFLCYNVDGMMVRSSNSRANQNGPEEYGFRGNAQNLDLNRDFIKMDSENAFTFVKTFHLINPSVFVDTHVSNGADYQYTLTLIHSLKERLTSSIQKITYNDFIPDMEKAMKKNNVELIPYVEMMGETIDKGIHAFNDLPRYAMGYASLFPCISITTETHMLKPFPIRVHTTYLYLKEILSWVADNDKKLRNARVKASEELMKKSHFAYNYTLTKKEEKITFKGYEHGYKKSEITGLNRLYYDRNKPYTKKIPYFNQYQAQDSVKIPKAYIVGAQCKNVIHRLKQNNVQMITILKDTTMSLSIYKVKDYKSPTKPYEGHYLHSKMEIEEENENIKLKKGDRVIFTNQSSRQFICSVLEPKAEDSYFAWNFFDSYLQEKEYFSDYVFEDLAVEILKKNPDLIKKLETKKKNDENFAKSQWEQLYFIYQNSDYFEPSFMRLPIFKLY
jgi:hypothetical protein